MKKFLATILALIYLSTAVGKVHLPGSFNKMLSWVLNSCTYCGTSSSTDESDHDQENQLCCDSGQNQVKHTDQDLTDTAIHPKRVCAEVSTPASYRFSLESFSSSRVSYTLINAPPQTATVCRYILHCVFRL